MSDSKISSRCSKGEPFVCAGRLPKLASSVEGTVRGGASAGRPRICICLGDGGFAGSRQASFLLCVRYLAPNARGVSLSSDQAGYVRDVGGISQQVKHVPAGPCSECRLAGRTSFEVKIVIFSLMSDAVNSAVRDVVESEQVNRRDDLVQWRDLRTNLDSTRTDVVMREDEFQSANKAHQVPTPPPRPVPLPDLQTPIASVNPSGRRQRRTCTCKTWSGSLTPLQAQLVQYHNDRHLTWKRLRSSSSKSESRFS